MIKSFPSLLSRLMSVNPLRQQRRNGDMYWVVCLLNEVFRAWGLHWIGEICLWLAFLIHEQINVCSAIFCGILLVYQWSGSLSGRLFSWHLQCQTASVSIHFKQYARKLVMFFFVFVRVCSCWNSGWLAGFRITIRVY